MHSRLEIRSTNREKDEVFLIAFTNAIVDPWAMMVHFSDTSLAHGAVMGSFRFDTAAFWTFKNNLSFFKTHLLYVFFGSVPPWNSSLKHIMILKMYFNVSLVNLHA